jgi:hypothetical protein
MTTSQPKTFTTQFSKLGVFLLFVFSITLVVVSVANAIHYDSILNLSNGDDTQIGVGRGSLIWFYWLNVILAIVSSFATIYFFYRLFFKSNITESKGIEFLSNKLGSEAKGVDVYLLEKNCKELGIEGNAFKGDCQKYGTLNNDKKVDFYLEKSFGIDEDIIKDVKDNFCKNKSGSTCNKILNNFGSIEMVNSLSNIDNDKKKEILENISIKGLDKVNPELKKISENPEFYEGLTQLFNSEKISDDNNFKTLIEEYAKNVKLIN